GGDHRGDQSLARLPRRMSRHGMKAGFSQPGKRTVASLFLLVAGCFALVGQARAEPRVVGYERFHAGKATPEGGAVLFSELGCANCHGGSAVVVPRQGPNLVDLASRVDREWLRNFLREPGEGRAGSPMPRLLHGRAGAEVEAALGRLVSPGRGPKLT